MYILPICASFLLVSFCCCNITNKKSKFVVKAISDSFRKDTNVTYIRIEACTFVLIITAQIVFVVINRHLPDTNGWALSTQATGNDSQQASEWCLPTMVGAPGKQVRRAISLLLFRIVTVDIVLNGDVGNETQNRSVKNCGELYMGSALRKAKFIIV